MIGVYKCIEPADHVSIRTTHLARLRSILARSSKDIHSYDSKKVLLWESQHGKCCYCEQKIQYPYNDVEHYRPKAEARREPGSTDTHGYWWLAYSWDNLFYSCASCNRSSKGSRFPLAHGSRVLLEETDPPGGEIALLAYPGCNDAVNLIEFELVIPGPYEKLAWWKAIPVNGNAIGRSTIDTIGLNEQDRIEVRMKYFYDTLNPLVGKIKKAKRDQDASALKVHLGSFCDLFFANQPFSVFAFSVFSKSILDCGEDLTAAGIEFTREMLGCVMHIDHKRIA